MPKRSVYGTTYVYVRAYDEFEKVFRNCIYASSENYKNNAYAINVELTVRGGKTPIILASDGSRINNDGCPAGQYYGNVTKDNITEVYTFTCTPCQNGSYCRLSEKYKCPSGGVLSRDVYTIPSILASKSQYDVFLEEDNNLNQISGLDSIIDLNKDNVKIYSGSQAKSPEECAIKVSAGYYARYNYKTGKYETGLCGDGYFSYNRIVRFGVSSECIRCPDTWHETGKKGSTSVYDCKCKVGHRKTINDATECHDNGV